ncbi:hypothetical protein SDC9_188841 [bioreactor metagenome]|uniref:Uncharacterized protein n=1 Tax=bioreactor metagenome TaxID=1076179 RepID=A0A645HQG5_9ZZZZ
MQLVLSGGLERRVNDLPVEIKNGNLFGLNREIVLAGGGKRKITELTVCDTDVSAGALRQSRGDQLFAVFDNCLTFFLHQHIGFLLSMVVIMVVYFENSRGSPAR